LGFDSFCALLQHSGVLHGVLLRNNVGNALAVDNGFSVECQQSGAEFLKKLLVQIRPPGVNNTGAMPRDSLFHSANSGTSSFGLLLSFQ
jgi:hypothetical protein